MSHCTATTAAGHPCKNHVVKGSQLCKAHGGSALDIRHDAPPGNTNAVKHGFYRPTIRQDEYADLLTYAEQFNLADELAITRVRLRRLMTYIDGREDTLDPDQYGRPNPHRPHHRHRPRVGRLHLLPRQAPRQTFHRRQAD